MAVARRQKGQSFVVECPDRQDRLRVCREQTKLMVISKGFGKIEIRWKLGLQVEQSIAQVIGLSLMR